MKPSDAIDALAALVPLGEPLFLWGPPGVGKSAAVHAAAGRLGYEVTDVRASQLDPVDWRGLPVVGKDGKTRWATPDFLPKTGPAVLFLDELPQASPDVQKPLFQLLADRRLGDYRLPDGVAVVAAGNRSEDRAGANRLLTPLLNRFASHIDVEVSVEDWAAWAVGAGLAPEVVAFVRFKPALLFQFDPAKNDRAFATPRTWEKAAKLLPVAPHHLLQALLAGCVGAGPAAEFCAFLQLYRQLPDVDAVLASPQTAPVPREPSVLYSLVGALGERVRAGKAPPAAFARYGMRLPDEFGMLALRDALALDRRLVADPAVQQWITAARARGLFAA